AVSPSGPPVSAAGTIAFIQGNDLWTMTADGSHRVQLTHEKGQNYANNPAFSPDGSQIAYVEHIAPSGDNWGGAELHVMKADGSDERTLVPAKGQGERSENPAWSADGKAIYYGHDLPLFDGSKYTGDNLSMDAIEVATGARRTVVKNAMYPTTSRSGALAWVLFDPATAAYQLEVGSLDGSDAHAVLSNKDFQAVYNPRLSPDGKKLIFSGSGRTNSKAASVGDSLADALNPLLPGRAQAHGLPWDPWVIGVDGTGLRKLMSIGSDEMALAWSPDGQAIALANLSKTYLLRPDGSGAHAILEHGDPGGLDWKSQ
ncbi:MAG: PD40 domain-containing protein, partial [Chloroflexota bacterium]|nr:PD40 domain-containing protein [Chloroflexota bacterium]